MDIALNEVSEIIYRYKGTNRSVKEVYYTSGAAKFKVWPCNAYTSKIQMVKLNSNGSAEIARYTVNIADDGETTTYKDASGNIKKGLSPGKYAVVATIKVKTSEKNNSYLTHENCWCQHIIVNGLNGITYYKSDDSSSGINVNYTTKRNPFTGEYDPYTIFDIPESNWNLEYRALPALAYVIRKPHSSGATSPLVGVGTVPNVEAAPLRIIRETPTCAFELKSGNTTISSGTTITENTTLSPSYVVKWSSGDSQRYVATASTSGDLFSLTKNGDNYNLTISKYPIPGSIDSQILTLSYEGQTNQYQIIIPTVTYAFNLSGDFSNDNNGYILYDTATVSVQRYFNGVPTDITGFTLESSNTAAVRVNGTTLYRAGNGNSSIITVKYNKEIIGTFNVTAKLKDIKLRYKVQSSTDSSSSTNNWTDVGDIGEVNNGSSAMIWPVSTPDVSNLGSIKQMRIIFLDDNGNSTSRTYTRLSGSTAWSNSGTHYQISGPCNYISGQYPSTYCTYTVEIGNAKYTLNIYYA